MYEALAGCKLCRRNCGSDRLRGKTGFCGAGKNIKIAKASLHYWEEPCISGSSGSGAIFFSHCNLKCVFCQNHPVSQQGFGKEVSVERLSGIFLELAEKGAHNINLVTPAHYVPQIIGSLNTARQKGLSIPVIYNTNAYENVETIKLLKGHIDVYLPDLKYFNDKYAQRYSGAAEYFAGAAKVVEEMVSQLGEVRFNKEGLIQRGVIIRHLMLPGLLFDSKKLIDYIYGTFGDSVYLSLMNQYTPMHRAAEYDEINKLLNPKHYEGLIDYCMSIGVKNAFIQEGGAASKEYVPPFDLEGV